MKSVLNARITCQRWLLRMNNTRNTTNNFSIMNMAERTGIRIYMACDEYLFKWLFLQRQRKFANGFTAFCYLLWEKPTDLLSNCLIKKKLTHKITFNQCQVAISFNFHFGKNSLSTVCVSDGAFVHQIAINVTSGVASVSMGMLLISSLDSIS